LQHNKQEKEKHPPGRQNLGFWWEGLSTNAPKITPTKRLARQHTPTKAATRAKEERKTHDQPLTPDNSKTEHTRQQQDEQREHHPVKEQGNPGTPARMNLHSKTTKQNRAKKSGLHLMNPKKLGLQTGTFLTLKPKEIRGSILNFFREGLHLELHLVGDNG
jgi:hypothetical protein